MGKVFVDMAMSLDGFIAGPNHTDGGLHDWYFAPSGNAVVVLDELLETIGAMISLANVCSATSQKALTPLTKCHISSFHTRRGHK